MADLFASVYNPDVLSCLANLSSDEVFTPPELANEVLDMLPKSIWVSTTAKFLDPCSKSGVFLREIAKRLIRGQLPDFEYRTAQIDTKRITGEDLDGSDEAYLYRLQKVIDHIFHEQIFGIGITELTALMTRRSVYCSKWANSPYSVTQFDTTGGNIRYRNIQHTWEGAKGKERCRWCGASKREMADNRSSSETYAYEFIHTSRPERLLADMTFDVIIGNPPYQMSFGIEGGNSANAKSIYNQFISQAIRLNPRYVCMITPSRWMTKTAQGIPVSWVDEMLSCNHFKIMHDFENASDCFPGVQIRGGVSYFLWERDYVGKCHTVFHDTTGVVSERFDYLDAKGAGIVIRDPRAYSILEKIAAVEGKYYADDCRNFSGLVSPKHFFDDSTLLTSNWTGYKSRRSSTYSVKYYMNFQRERTYRWISESQIPKHKGTKDLWKVFIPGAGGSGNDTQILGKPFIGEPNSVCSQTFLVIGYDPDVHKFTEANCKSIVSYISTCFFRYLVSIKKKTQNGPRGVYQFVPLQAWDEVWTDHKLYEKYGLSDEDVAFIESLVKPMDLGDCNA